MTEKELTKKAGAGAEMWSYAQALSRATVIPKAYQGQAANCFVALDMAQRLGVGVMEVMQNCFVVHGTPGFSSKWSIGMANKKGPFKGPIAFEYGGAPGNESATAFAIVEATGERVEFTADMAMAKAEKWTSNPKYRSMPKLMLSYRAATLLIRLYCPEVLLGMQTADELEDTHAAGQPPREAEAQVVEDLNAEIEAPAEPDVLSELQEERPGQLIEALAAEIEAETDSVGTQKELL